MEQELTTDCANAHGGIPCCDGQVDPLQWLRPAPTPLRSPRMTRLSAAARFIGRLQAPIFPMTKSLAHQLAEYACSLKYEDLSRNVVHEVKRRVIDSLGCALGAWNEEPCAIARKVASDFSAKNGATIIGTTHKAPPDWAAFANGCCIRYFDYNDTYLSKEPAHPSDNFSAVLAVGGKRRRERTRS